VLLPGHEPFLKTIVENPEDDTPRLAYADWLDESGDEDRAEFIRLQIAGAAELPEGDPRRVRVAELERRNYDRWYAELPATHPISWALLRRGFFCGVTAWSVAELTACCREVFAASPVEYLTVYGADATGLAKLLREPGLGRLTYLDLRECRITSGSWHVIAKQKNLSCLRTLRLFHNGDPTFTYADARLFVDSPHLARLKVLGLGVFFSDTTRKLLETRFTLI
jgi:uncharacterized protein (TIGR02996 family)